jgi:hypothetical protein
MPAHCQLGHAVAHQRLTILVEDVEALFDQQRRVQDDQAVANRQHIVAGAGLEEGADRSQALDLLAVDGGDGRSGSCVLWLLEERPRRHEVEAWRRVTECVDPRHG